VIAASLFLTVFAPSASASTFTVDSTTDAGDADPSNGVCATDDGACTLRAAVQQANALAGPDEVDIPAGTYRLTIAGTGEDAAATGDLDVTESLTVIGASARTVTLSGKPSGDLNAQATDRVFDVQAGGSLTMSKVTVDGGAAQVGGNIRAAGPVSLTDVTNVNGSATDGGGIWGTALLQLDRSTISGNRAGRGAGVASSGGLTAVNTTFYGNGASSEGGGLAVLGGSADIVNVTFAGNWVTGSSSPAGGQIYNNGTTQIRNSILERTAPSGPNCGGDAVTSGGHNVDDDGSCALSAAGDRGNNSFELTFYKPVNAGGETDSIPPFAWPLGLLSGLDFSSGFRGPGAAVDIGAENCPAGDQRGLSRPQGASCDAGAYEAAFADLVMSLGGGPAQLAPGEQLMLPLTVRNDGPAAVVPVVVGVSSVAYSLARDGSPCVQSYPCMGTLAPGQSVTLDLRATAPASGPLSLDLAAIADELGPVEQATLDPNPSNSRATLSIPVVQPPTPPMVSPPLLKRGACANAKTGTRRGDTLTGSLAGDLIRGLAGNDRLRGLAGDDCVDGGPGSDTLDGGPGADRLTGGRGRDTLKGGTGNDTLNAADHQKDTVDCGMGRDRATVDRIDRVKHCEKVGRKR
jgi:CSLREA domain-containing protein